MPLHRPAGSKLQLANLDGDGVRILDLGVLITIGNGFGPDPTELSLVEVLGAFENLGVGEHGSSFGLPVSG